MRPRRLLLTGAAGEIGRVLRPALGGAGAQKRGGSPGARGGGSTSR